MPEATPTLTTPHRWPAGGTKPGTKPAPVPLPTLNPTRRPAPPPTGRRALLAGATAAALGGALASCVPPPGTAQGFPPQFPEHGGRAAQANPDADLIALCAEYVALDRAFIANGLATNDMLLSDPRYEPLNEQGRAMVPRLHELEALIADIVPQTGTGLLAKAEAARRSLVSDADDDEGGELLNFETYLACTLIENLLAMTGEQA